MSEQSQTSSGDQELQRHKDKIDFGIYTEFLDAVRERTKTEVVECLSQLLKSSNDTAQGHPTPIFGKYLFGRRFEI